MKQTRSLPNTYISESIKKIDKLSECARDYLGVNPKQLNLHVIPKQQNITLLVDSPVFASQLNYQKTEVLQHINKTFLSGFKRVEIKVSPRKLGSRPEETVTIKLPTHITDMLSGLREELSK